MVEFVQDTLGIRTLPISNNLKKILLLAAQEARVDKIRVTSGGQCAKGTCSKRTGSTRHDLGNAADLQLWVGNKVLKFTDNSDLKIYKAFVTAVARLGATGIGAGVGYMGADKIHVGFGSKAIWGEGGLSKNAPKWLIDAAESGWATSKKLEMKTYKILARDGLFLRSGPSLDFDILQTLKEGTLINIDKFEGESFEWGRTDLVGDGQIDGFVHSAFVEPIDFFEVDMEIEQDNCTDGESSID